MPKAANKKQVVATNKKGKLADRAKISVAVKSEPTESANPLAVSKHIAAIHFEELNNIWESDRRIPTIASRTAWSLARNLNPINVNSWWYRRRTVAKKFKINIPEDSYVLEVGIPPLVIVKIETKESADSDSAFPNSGSGDTLVDLSSSTCADLVASNKKSSGATDTPLKDAYIHDSKLSDDVVVASDCTLDVSAPAFCDSSPLPPSSPNIWPSSSLPPLSRIASPELDPDLLKESSTPGSDCILVLDHNFSTSTDDWKRIELVAELDGPFDAPSESSLPLTPFQPCQWSEAFLSFYAFPTWCFDGFRIAYDGSIVCDCLCSNRVESCSAETPYGQLDDPVLTDGPGDGLVAA